MNIPVVFITDENFIMQTGVAIYSMIINKKEKTKYDLYIVMAECSKKSEQKLKKLESKDVKIHIVEAALNKYKDIRQLSHIPISCLLKFEICDLICDCDKLIYLDGDILVRGDLSSLYQIDLKEKYIAGVPSLDMLFDDRKLINAGILLFNARKMRENCMSEKLISKRRELGDQGSMDQQTFNLIMSDKMSFLPCTYNCILNRILGTERKNFPIEKLNSLYHTSFGSTKEMVDNAVIWHYATNGKPWAYSYIKGSDEWYKCYLSSPFGVDKLKRKGSLQVHLEGIQRNLRKGGLKAVFERIGWYINAMLGKNKYDKWG